MARSRRNAAAAKRTDAKAVRQSNGIMPAKIARIAYHSKSKDEITVRVIEFVELKTNKRGEQYIAAIDVEKGERRSFTIARIGWAVAA